MLFPLPSIPSRVMNTPRRFKVSLQTFSGFSGQERRGLSRPLPARKAY